MKNKYPHDLSFSNIENNIYPIKDNKNLPVLNDIFDDEQKNLKEIIYY